MSNEQLVVALEARVRQFERDLQRANRTAQSRFSQIERRGARASRNLQAQFATSAAAINQALGTVGANFGVLGTIGRGGMFAAPIAAAGAFTVALRRVSAEVAQIGAKADAVGVTTEELQKLRFAAEQASGSAEALDRGLERLTRNIGEAASGKGEFLRVLQANGVALRDQQGNLRSTGELFRQYARLVQNAANPTDQLRLATIAFGNAAGPELVGLLRGGTDAIDNLSQAAVDAGAVLDDELVRRAQEIDDGFNRLTRTIGTRFRGAILTAADAAGDLFGQLKAALDLFKETGSVRPMRSITDQLKSVEMQLAENRRIAEEMRTNPDMRGNPVYDANRRRTAEEILRLEMQRRELVELRRQFDRPAFPEREPLAMTVTPTVIPGQGDDTPARGGRAGGGRSESELMRQIERIQELTRALEAEQQMLGMSGEQALRARTEFELLEAAKRSGVDVTDELRVKIGELAEAYANASTSLDRMKAMQQEMQQIAQSVGDQLASGFADAIVNGERLDKVLQRILQSLARMLLQRAFQSLFSGIFSAIGFKDGGPVQAFATGGHVRGPGTATSDSIPALLSNGEYVINAKQTARHRALLEQINAGNVPRFATGGIVGGSSIPSLAGAASSRGNGAAITVAPTINIEGGSQGPEADEELARKITREMEEMTRAVVVSEMRMQMRPGGMVNNVRR